MHAPLSVNSTENIRYHPNTVESAFTIGLIVGQNKPSRPWPPSNACWLPRPLYALRIDVIPR